MAKKITDFAELPQWFRDSNYLHAQRFTDIDWFFHLESRFHVMSWDYEIEDIVQELSSEQNPDNRRINEEDLAAFRSMRTEQLEIIRQNPASPLEPHAALSQLGPAFDELGILIFNRHVRPISRITLYDLYYLLRELSPTIRKDLLDRLDRNRHFGVDAGKSALIASYVDMSINQLLGRSQEFHAVNRISYDLFRIDLTLPDDALRKSFDNVLRTARSDEQKYGLDLDQDIKVQFRNWVNKGVLPYIDLKTWAKDNDRAVTSGFLTKAFDEFQCIRDPDLKYSAYTIDTTVKKYVDAALSWQTRRRLQAAASKDIESRENR